MTTFLAVLAVVTVIVIFLTLLAGSLNAFIEDRHRLSVFLLTAAMIVLAGLVTVTGDVVDSDPGTARQCVRYQPMLVGKVVVPMCAEYAP